MGSVTGESRTLREKVWSSLSSAWELLRRETRGLYRKSQSEYMFGVDFDFTLVPIILFRLHRLIYLRRRQIPDVRLHGSVSLDWRWPPKNSGWKSHFGISQFASYSLTLSQSVCSFLRSSFAECLRTIATRFGLACLWNTESTRNVHGLKYWWCLVFLF